MMETEKGKRIEQILATDVTREQLAEALWCAESSQRMWHGCAEENRSFRLKAEAENAKLRELVLDMLPFAEVGMDDTCVIRRCCLFEQCEDVVGGKCAIEQHMLDRMRELRIEVE